MKLKELLLKDESGLHYFKNAISIKRSDGSIITIEREKRFKDGSEFGINIDDFLDEEINTPFFGEDSANGKILERETKKRVV